MRDLRYAFRKLLRTPGFTLAAVLVLALGIGANSAIFTVIRAVLLAPLPYPHPERLVNLFERNVVSETAFNTVSAPNLYDWQRDAHGFEQMAFYGEYGTSFWPDDGGLPENIRGAICSYNLFATLGAQPALGRTFTAADDVRGATPVVIISDSLWKQRFGGRPEVIGQKARLGSEPHTIVGVMPAGFDYPRAEVQVWLPVWQKVPTQARQERGNHRFMALARLKPGVSVEAARTELDGIAQRIRQQHPEELTGKGANVVRMDERMVSGVRPMLLVLLGAVACVLLIACVNVTNLLLARAVSRRREVAVRVALGANRAQIVKQFLAESSILSLAGAVLGLGIAMAGTGVLIRMAGYIPRIQNLQVNGAVLSFTAAVSLAVGVAVGLVPALWSWRAGLASAMQEGGRSATAGRRRGMFRDALVAAEIALSLMLLAGAGLMLKSLSKLHGVAPGFATERVLVVDFSLPGSMKPEARVAAFYRDLVEQVRSQPGVQSAGLVTVAPLAGHFMDFTFTIEGRPPLPQGHFLDAVVRSADPGYFQAMGIPVKRGRVFNDADGLEAAGKAVISESMASTFFPGEDPIGKRLRIGDPPTCEIIGIVGDTRQNLAQAPEPVVYFPLYQGRFTFASLMVRAAGDPNLLSLPLQKILRSLAPDMPAVTVKTVDEMMDGATSQSRFGLTLIALFALLAVGLAAIGLYGVLAYSVGQRTSEFGIRMALGAAAPEITRLVLWQGLKAASIGIAAGLAGAMATARLLRSVLFEVSPNDPWVMLAVAALIALVAIVASFVPTWRATRIDPVAALRAE
ncbi:MAG TPA: ABC transporter permease [Bryobacteraceae bacterium]|nr:ABC transporter permease [Bryobacteraceae bacterium]